MLLAVAFSTDFRKKVLVFLNPDQICLFLEKKAHSAYGTCHCQICFVWIPAFIRALEERGPEPVRIVD